MERKRQAFLMFILCLLALLLATPFAAFSAGEKSSPSDNPTTLIFMSGSPGGSWYPTAIALAAIWQSNIPNLSFQHIHGGGTANAKGIGENKAPIVLSTSVSVGDAVKGNPPFKKPMPDIRAMGAFPYDLYNFVVFANSPIRVLKDLKGKRINPAKKGWTTETIAKRQLEAVGLSYKDMAKVEFVTPEEGVQLMKDGHIDALTPGFDPTGSPELTELSLFKKIRIIPVPDDVIEKLRNLNPGYNKVIIPKGSYKGVEEDVQGIAAAVGVFVRPELSEDLVYRMTKSMVENWESHMQPVLAQFRGVSPKALANPVLGVPFHPGTSRYYKERGWIK